MQQLTDVQRKLAEEHHSLIYSFAALHKLAPDEWYDVLAIGYVKGIAVYDPAKGALSTITYRAMRAEWLKAVRAKNCLKRSGAVCSLDMERGESLCLYDCMEDKKDVINDAITGMDFARALKPISECGRLLLLLRASGVTVKEIAAKLHISQNTIYRRYSQLKGELLMETDSAAENRSTSRSVWTPDRVEELRKLAAEHKTTKELAEHFGVSLPSMASALSRYNIRLTKKQTVTDSKKPPFENPVMLCELVDSTLERLEVSVEQLRINNASGWYNMGCAISMLERIQYTLTMHCYGCPPPGRKKAPLGLQPQRSELEITSLSV